MSTEPMKSLLNPQSIAVVGASQRRGRGMNVIANLRDAGFKGEIFAVNPRYDEVLGYKCYAGVAELPEGVDCIVVAVGADSACEVLDEAHAKGIPAAAVLAAGFGEGGHGEARALRLKALAEQGMCICGPNCFGFINVKDQVAAFSGPLARPLRPGSVALVSQSGGLGASAFTPLMADRGLGFSYFVSCGNQLGATIEDFVEYFVADPAVDVVAIVIEALKNPQKLAAIAQRAHARRKSLLLYQAGRSAAGQVMIRSHTGALAANGEVLAAFLRRCGVVQIKGFDEFVETIELFATAPHDDAIADDVIVVSGSGGGAANATDALDEAGVKLAEFEPTTREGLRAVQPEFGSVTNPIDGTGAMYDDPALMPKIFAALTGERRRPVIAASVSVRAGGNESTRRLAGVIADAARASGRTFVAFQYTPLGGPLDSAMIGMLHEARVPVLLGISNTMRALRYLPMRRNYWQRAATLANADPAVPRMAADSHAGDFLMMRKTLLSCGIPVVDAALARSEEEAVAVQRRFGVPVAVKAEMPGVLHKSDIGCVQLDCAGADVAQAYRAVVKNAGKAGFKTDIRVIVQPMIQGVAEAYAGVIDDRLFGPAICFGLGGIFVEIFNDVRTEMAPLSRPDALAMIHGIKSAKILTGARGRVAGDIDALADLLIRLGQFALANAGRLRALELNPIIVKARGEGVVAVDIAAEIAQQDAAGIAAPAAS
jgi:acetate---CoA ligase (ADP-forming)